MAEWDRVPTTDEWIESLEELPMLGELILAADAGFEQFCATYPYPWLFFGGDKGDIRRPGDPGSADSSPDARESLTLPRREQLVFAVKKRRDSTAEGADKKIVSVGSGPDNDVVVPDEMVADVHALIREAGGEFFLAPGPEVRIAPLKLNAAPVSAADPQGVPLRSKDVLTLQDLEVVFLSPSAMFDLVQTLD